MLNITYTQQHTGAVFGHNQGIPMLRAPPTRPRGRCAWARATPTPHTSGHLNPRTAVGQAAQWRCTFSKVSSLLILCRKDTKALTLENFSQPSWWEERTTTARKRSRLSRPFPSSVWRAEASTSMWSLRWNTALCKRPCHMWSRCVYVIYRYKKMYTLYVIRNVYVSRNMKCICDM